LFKSKILIALTGLMLCVACVSKKKYNTVSALVETKSSEKAALEDILNKLLVENDSLKKEIQNLEDMNRAEREKNNGLAAKSEGRGLNLKGKPSLISGKEEYNKKALFLYSFISYIVWPNDKSTSFKIGIVGESPIKEPLAGYVYSKNVNKLPIEVETYQPGKAYKILFFSEAGQAQFSKIKKQFNGQTVLYITENSNLEKLGSHISLYVDGAKIKFTANKPALEKSGLKVSNSFYSLSD